MSNLTDRLKNIFQKDEEDILVGSASQLANTGAVITVSLKNGNQVTAIAGNEINSSNVAVILGEDRRYYAFSGTSPEMILQTKEAQVNIPLEEEPEEEILPFQVVISLDGQVFLGGDRPVESLGGLSNRLDNILGVTNRGNQQYFAGWYDQEGCNVTWVNSESDNIRSAFPFCPFVVDNINLDELNEYLQPFVDLSNPKWIGYGYVSSQYFPLPNKDEATENTGEELPLDTQNPPYYPRFGFREKDQAVRQGRELITQNYPFYSFRSDTNWDYIYQVSGNSDRATPDYYFATCSAVYSTPFVFTFSRETKTNYHQLIEINLSSDYEIRLGARIYSQPKTLTYREQYELVATPALFNSAVFYTCRFYSNLPGYFFSQGSYVPSHSDANWSGEETTQTKTIESILKEEDWDCPVSLTGDRIRRDYERKTLNFEATYTVQSESWQLQGAFPSGFNFEVPGEEVQKNIETIEIDRIYPEIKLLGYDTSESFFSESVLKRNIRKQRDSQYDIPMLLYSYSHKFPTVVNDLETTTVTTEEWREDFYYSSNRDSYLLSPEGSFYFETQNDSQLSDTQSSFTFVFRNNQSPLEAVGRILVNEPLDYTKTETFAPYRTSDAINYSQSRGYSDLPDQIIGENIHLVTEDRVYFGKVQDYVYSDYATPGFEIQTFRDITSVFLVLEGYIDYRSGLVEPGYMAVYSADNCLALLRQKLFTPGQIEYCNLVAGNLYYSKSVVYQLQATEQSTMMFSVVGDLISYSGNQTGQFVPVENTEDAEKAKGVAYYPIV